MYGRPILNRGFKSFCPNWKCIFQNKFINYPMAYFSKDYLDFFQKLEVNNSKDWFDQNRKRYENSVRKPMIALVEDVIAAMQDYDINFHPDPKKCLGRINRDIRFSKDKTPYNIHFFAHISKGPKGDSKPGIAFRFGGNDSGIMSGYYNPPKEKLADIKHKIKSNLDEFQNLKSNKNFIAKFGKIQGEAYKRIPTAMKSTFENEPLMANKQFYYVAQKEAEFVLSENLKDTIIQHWLAVKDLNEFFE